MDKKLETILRDALDAEPPADADSRILAAIRMGANARRRKQRLRVLAVAAALAVFLGGGMWQYGLHRGTAAQGEVAAMDESDLMLEIIDMAEPLDLAAFQVAQL